MLITGYLYPVSNDIPKEHMKFGCTMYRFSLRWLFIVSVLGVLFPSGGSSQTLREADSLSSIHQYEASTLIYKAFLTANSSRIYDQSSAWLGISHNALETFHYQEALQANENSRSIRERLRVEDIAENYLQSARIFLEIGQWDAALEHLDMAGSIPNDDPLVFAQIESMRAEAFSGKQEFPEADIHYQRALENTVAELGEAHPESARLLLRLGVFYTHIRFLNNAEEALLRARRSAGGLLNEEILHVEIALALGELSLVQEKLLAARTWFLHAIDLMETHHFHGKGNLDSKAYLGLSRADLANGQVAEATTQIQNALESVYPELPDGFDSFVLNPTVSPENPFLAAEIWYHASLCIAPDNKLQLRYLEHAISILEGESLVFHPAQNRVNLIRQIEKIAGQATEICVNAGDTSMISLAYAWFARARKAILLAETANQDEKYISDYSLADLLAPQKNLDEKTAVIAYFEAGGRLFMLAFNSENYIAIPLASWRSPDGQYADELPMAIRKYLDAIYNTDAENLISWSNTFYQWLIQPAEKLLAKKTRLVIIPTEQFMALPFEVLFSSIKNNTKGAIRLWRKIPWLATRFELSYAVSLQGATGVPPKFEIPIDIRAVLDTITTSFHGLGLPHFSRDISRLNLRGYSAVWKSDYERPFGEGSLSPVFASFSAGVRYLWMGQNEGSKEDFLYARWESESSNSYNAAEALRRARVRFLQSKTQAAPAVWWNGRIFQN